MGLILIGFACRGHITQEDLELFLSKERAKHCLETLDFDNSGTVCAPLSSSLDFLCFSAVASVTQAHPRTARMHRLHAFLQYPTASQSAGAHR